MNLETFDQALMQEVFAILGRNYSGHNLLTMLGGMLLFMVGVFIIFLLINVIYNTVTNKDK